jgi:hypothetical protein
MVRDVRHERDWAPSANTGAMMLMVITGTWRVIGAI